jgi:TRAP transporter TAXI family solute receptor
MAERLGSCIRLALLLLCVCALSACNSDAGLRGARWISIATGNTGGVYYPYGGALAKVIGEALPNVKATAEATNASVDNLKLLHQGKAEMAFTLADTLDDAIKGAGAFEEMGPVSARTLAVLYRNYTHLVTVEGRGINNIRGLKGRLVSTGSPGSGTEVIALRILRAAGLNPQLDVTRQSLSVNASVDAIKDGKIDAFFWSGGLPTASVLDLASTMGVKAKLLENDYVLSNLQSSFGSALYARLMIPSNAYPGMGKEVAVIGVANALVVHERMDEQLAYDLTRVLFDKQAELAAIHPEAGKLKLADAVAGSPAPFHPGAIRFFKERGVWKQ